MFTSQAEQAEGLFLSRGTVLKEGIKGRFSRQRLAPHAHCVGECLHARGIRALFFGYAVQLTLRFLCTSRNSDLVQFGIKVALLVGTELAQKKFCHRTLIDFPHLLA